MKREFYLAERDQDRNENPSAWVISKDEKTELIFIRRGEHWVCVVDSEARKLSMEDYNSAKSVLPE